MSMMRTAISIGSVWRPPLRTTDDVQATVTLQPVKLQDQTLSVALDLHVTLPLPEQTPALPGGSRPMSITPA
jgi:hypothetical protein